MEVNCFPGIHNMVSDYAITKSSYAIAARIRDIVQHPCMCIPRLLFQGGRQLSTYSKPKSTFHWQYRILHEKAGMKRKCDETGSKQTYEQGKWGVQSKRESLRESKKSLEWLSLAVMLDVMM